MSDDGPGAIKLIQRIWPHLGRGSVAQVAFSCGATAVIRATEPRRDRPGASLGETHKSRLSEGGPSEICTGFVTDQRLTTANAAERPKGCSAAFLQVSGCLLRLFGVAERPRPQARSDVVVVTD